MDVETYNKVIELGEQSRRVNRELLKLKHNLKSIEFVDNVCPACKGNGVHTPDCWIDAAIKSISEG